MSKWQPIESAPRDGTRILVWGRLDGECEDGPHPLPAYCDAADEDGGTRWLAQGLETVEYPTHWMPLPPPPEQAP